MGAGTESRVRWAGVILLLIVAMTAAPMVDDVVGFLSEAPYVRYLPMALDGGAEHSLVEVATSVWSALHMLWGDRLRL